MLKLSVCSRGAVSLYLYKAQGGASAILGEKPRVALPQHGGMPPLVEGVAMHRRQGVARP